MRVFKATLAVMMAAWAMPAAAAWFEVRTDHFTVYSDGEEGATRAFAAKLERFDQGMRKLRGLYDGELQRANPLTVYVVTGISQVQKLCGGAAGKASGSCKSTAGFYTGSISGARAFTPRYSDGNPDAALTILFHEYGHHIMMANSGAAFPAWFTEGYAEFSSTARFDRKGKIGFGVIAYHRAYGLTSGGDMPITDLLTSTTSELKTPERLDLFYGRAWLLTHFLTFEPSRAGQLETYLTLINQGRPGLDAAKEAFGDLEALDRDLDKYMRKSLSFFELPVAEIPPQSLKSRRLEPGEQAMMPVRLRSERGVDNAEAATLVIEARQLAAPFQKDPGAQLVLAEAELDADNPQLAEAAADRVLAADPNNYKALLFKGRALMTIADHAGSREEGTWRRIRALFVKANGLRNNGAEALWLFYRSYWAQGIAATPNAIAALERASALAPQDGQVRFALAGEYLRASKLPEARLALASLAYDPHAKPGNIAAKLIEAIDAKDMKRVNALMSGSDDAEFKDAE